MEGPAVERPKGPLDHLKNIVILPPKFSVYETSVGEVTEKMPEWSERARTHLLQAVQAEMQAHGIKNARVLTVDHLSLEQLSNLQETQALFDVVGQSVWLHVQGNSQSKFPGMAITDYTLGKEIELLSPDADGFIFLSGVDQISTSGRVAKKVVTTLLLAALGVVTVQTGGITAGAIGVVDAHTGTLLWWNGIMQRGGIDTRTPEGAHALMQQLTNGFPWPAAP